MSVSSAKLPGVFTVTAQLANLITTAYGLMCHTLTTGKYCGDVVESILNRH